MLQTCRRTGKQFEVSEGHLQFYDRISPIFSGKKYPIPAPTLSPEERQRHRMAQRNEATLYKRSCDLCRKQIIALYPASAPFPVYCPECFWSNSWNALDYGQGFVFDEPFFEQYARLLSRTPRLAIINKKSENSAYCNYSFANKNCYLTFGNHYEENCLYGRYSTKNKFCAEYLYLYQSELCYECTYSKNCYQSIFLDHCEESSDCAFSKNLKGCQHCLFSVNLRHQQYHIFNKPYSKEEYFEKLKAYQLKTSSGIAAAKIIFERDVLRKFPDRAAAIFNSENATGNNLEHCKNVHDCFDCANCEDIAYAAQIDETYRSQDMTCMGYDRSEFCYQTIGCSGAVHCLFCDSCWDTADLLYSNSCFSSQNLFGCISLQHKKYCILNQQYSKEEYEKLVPRIIEHMQNTPLKSPLPGGRSEWGEFFPLEISPFGYNETIAQEYFPLTKGEILNNKWKWKEIEESDFSGVTKKIPATKLPDSIDQIPDDILNWAIECAQSKRLFKIQKAELEFYRKMNLPIPKFHPDIRHAQRMKLRNPRKLWERNCMNCQKPIETTYAPERPEIVYCEECYLKTVY